MFDNVDTSAMDLSVPYEPAAIFNSEADTVEYVRDDELTISRRVDRHLTLFVRMEDRSEVIGFRLKGFRNLYISRMKPIRILFEKNDDFVLVADAIEEAIREHFEDAEFTNDEIFAAYKKAAEIAVQGGARVETQFLAA